MLEARSLAYEINQKSLIKEISLNFKPGALYGILGPNGSGKSTFLKTLSGIWLPTKGSVNWNGTPLLNLPRKEISRIITLVPQNPQIHFDFSVSDIVRMGRYPYRSSHCNDALESALKTVDAWHLKDRSILHLSHGERKRIYLARALITESPILLLDEPEASLDLRHKLEIWHLLKTLIKQNKIIIVANHDINASKRFCDEIAVLNEGCCTSSGTFENVMTPACLQEVFGVSRSKLACTHQFDIHHHT